MLKNFNRLLALAAALLTGFGLQAQMPEGANRTAPPTVGGDQNGIVERATRRRALANAREAAATRQQASLKAKGGKIDPALFGVNPAGTPKAAVGAAAGAKTAGTAPLLGVAAPGPGFQLSQPDYMFGTASNWHNTKPIKKFVDGLPGLGAANKNNLGNFIPVAQPITGRYSDGSDYYELAVVEYTQQLHSELSPTKLRGYKDISPNAEVTTNGANSSNYLGPVIIAKRDKPVRVQLTNQLATGAAGDLFIPVDTTMMGAGLGPLGGTATYTQNRAELHLHGGLNPWISDGTPHQWITPAGENTPYKKGATFQNVPDMGAGTAGDGIATYYWTNQQSGRLMFYHDHTFGLTRLNVYAGEAAGYLIVDPKEDRLINAGILPNNGGGVYNYGIPLIIQDKTFVNTKTLGTVGVAGGTDPTWSVAKYGGDGSLWYPHVYMPNQNPADMSGANAMGRWDYAQWFWPPVPLAINNNGVGLQHGAEPVPGDLNGTEIPGTPNPSLVPEAFMDTPVVNGAAYPTINVDPKAYRFRILNASNDRFWNLSFFQADASGTEVSMVSSAPTLGWPATWPTDGRPGGVPDPATAGPSFVQIGNESGFLPAPVEIAPQPVGYNYNRRDIVVLNVQDKGLYLGAAERADVVVDFSAFAGKTLILYNDAPTPMPAFDPRFDYFTNDPDQTSTGGAATTLPGYGPNTRTVMQFVVANTTTAATYDVAALQSAFVSTDTTPGIFADTQHLPIVPQVAYAAALNQAPATVASLTAAGMSTTPVAFANNVYARIQDNQFRFPFPATENGTATQPVLQAKAIQELFELDYGRMNATLGVELPLTNFANQTTIPLGYLDPATEILTDGTTQYWKITHNGVDSHPVHFHLFDVQIVNRVGWDGAVRLPEANELGWKETVKMHPLEDVIVAFRPLSPRLPFALPNSQRLTDVTKPANAPISWTDIATGNAVAGTNTIQNFGWEYVWHCHILGHEENDFMRPMVLNVATTKPAAPTLLTSNLFAANRGDFSWTDNSTDETGFAIQRRVHGSNAAFATIGTTVPNDYTFSDFTVDPAIGYDYRVIAYNQAGESAPSNLAYINLPMTRMSGTVTTFNGVSIVPKPGVTITASTGEVAVSDVSGNYSIDLGAPYTGTLTATLAGFRFTPAARSYTSAAVNQTAQDFTAIPVITMSGQATLNAAALSGVTMTFSSGQTATTDASGNYTMTLDGPWTGTVVPSLVGYFFNPAVTSYSLVSTNQIQNYTATVAYSVSGTVYSGLIAGGANGPGLANVTVNLVGAAGNFTATTNAAGAYSTYVPSGWTGTITPLLAGTSFTPGNRSLTNVVANTAAQNFTVAYTLIVSAFNAAAPLNLVIVTFTGATGFSTTAALTNATGLTSVVLPKGWTGTVTPFALLRTFSPANATVTALAANRTQYFNTATRTIVGTTKRVSNNGNVGAVTLTYTGATGFPSGTATSAANSNYAITVPYGWTGTVAASGGTFTTWHYLTSTGAATATYTNVTANQTAQAWLGQ